MRILSVLVFSAMLAQAASGQNVKVPAPSPSTTVKQDFALGQVELSYSRPAKKGRVIFGDLVPYDKVWRTGANAATTISFSDEVMIGGQQLAPGKYGLLTIPGKSEWTIIISKQTNVNNPNAYKQSEDLVRVKAPVKTLSTPVESFTIRFDDVLPTSMKIALEWDKTRVELPVTADIDARVMAQIREAMQSDQPPYYQAAMYYLETGKDLNQAVDWFDKAAAAMPQAYWILHNQALAYAKLGKKKEAAEAARKSLAAAREARNDDYVKLNEKLLTSLK